MNTHPVAAARTKSRAGLFVLVAIAVLTAGCSSTTIKKYEVAIRVPGPGPAKSAAEAREIPVLAVTAQAMKEDQERYLELGADGFITKPIDIENFREGIKEALK